MNTTRRRGIDIAHHQGKIDVRKIHESGINDLYLKFSEYHIDHMVLEYLTQLRDFIPDVLHDAIDPFRIGLYHLWHGELPETQADLMVGAYDHWGLYHPPSLDLETDDKDHPEVHFIARATPEELRMLVRVIKRVLDEQGRCKLYLSDRGAKALRKAGVWDDIWMPGVSLWLCDHGSKPTDLEGAPPWSWWQEGVSEEGEIPGISTKVDLDEVR